MSPNARERAYEKRRYEEWQAKLTERKLKRRRAQRISMLVASAVVVVLVVVGVVLLVRQNSGDDATTATPEASATPAASASASAAAATNKACPAPTVSAPANPKQYTSAPAASVAQGKTWDVTFDTTCGKITMALDGKLAPKAVSSIITLARDKFFDDTPCHRLTTSGIYVLQCGDPTGTGTGGPGYQYGPVENAPKDGVYPAGTVAMARAQSEDSQGSQFFLVYQDSTIGGPTSKDNPGYTVLGKITSGLDVVRKVASGGTDDANGQGDGGPKEKVSILSTSVTAGQG